MINHTAPGNGSDRFIARNIGKGNVFEEKSIVEFLSISSSIIRDLEEDKVSKYLGRSLRKLHLLNRYIPNNFFKGVEISKYWKRQRVFEEKSIVGFLSIISIPNVIFLIFP